MLKPYVVAMDERFVRNAEMLQTGGLSDDQFDNIDWGDIVDDPNWGEMEPNPLISVIQAYSQDDAIVKAGAEKRYDNRVLYAEAIPMPGLYLASVLYQCVDAADGRLLDSYETMSGLVLAMDPMDVESRIREELPLLMKRDPNIRDVSVIQLDSKLTHHTAIRPKFILTGEVRPACEDKTHG